MPAGTWHLVGDGIVLGTDANQVDVSFAISWRRAIPDGGGDTLLALFGHHFVRRVPGGFLATPFTASTTVGAVPANPGDRLVLRITATAGDPGVLFVPNGDGPRAQGDFPRIDLPQ